MALLNGLYVHAKSETIENSYNKTNNPVESGVDITDHIERNLIKLKLEGELIDTPTLTAGKMYSQLVLWANAGTLIAFRGRNVFDGVITNVNKVSTSEISNGAEVTIDFEEIRIANSPYTAPSKNAGTQQVQTTKETGKEVWHTVQKGEWLLKIARKYNTTLEWILANNKLKSGNPNLIYPGEKILVSRNGLPNTATASTQTKSATKAASKTVSTAKKTADKASATVARVNAQKESTEQSYVVTETSKKVDMSQVTKNKNCKGTTISALQKYPQTLIEKVNDSIARLRDYVKWFRKTYPEQCLPYYETYVNYIEYDVKVIENNFNKRLYSYETSGYKASMAETIKNRLTKAISYCDKAKIKVEEAIKQKDNDTWWYKQAEKAKSHLYCASEKLYENMNDIEK